MSGDPRLGTTTLGSGYRTARGSLDLKPYSTASCNVAVTHDANAVDLVETLVNEDVSGQGERRTENH